MHRLSLPQRNIPGTHFCVAVSSSRVKISHQRPFCPKCFLFAHANYICTLLEYSWFSILRAHFDPQRWDHYIISKGRDPVTQWHDIISQKNKNLNCAVTKAWNSFFLQCVFYHFSFSPCIWYGYVCHLYVRVEVLIAVSIKNMVIEEVMHNV